MVPKQSKGATEGLRFINSGGGQTKVYLCSYNLDNIVKQRNWPDFAHCFISALDKLLHY